MASNGLLTNSIRDDDMRARLTKIAKDAADRLSGKAALAGDELLSLERQLEEAVVARNIDKLRFLLFQAQRSGADSPVVRGARSSLQSVCTPNITSESRYLLILCPQVLELSNARKALVALVEEDADAYAITSAIEHARRVGVDSDVRLVLFVFVRPVFLCDNLCPFVVVLFVTICVCWSSVCVCVTN